MSPIGSRGVDFKVRFSQFGSETVNKALQAVERHVSGMTTSTKAATRSSTELGRSFRNIALRTAAIVGIVRSVDLITSSIRSAISAGIEYNEVIEQSTLAIASLIAAQGKITTESGRQLEGVEKLDAAYELATEQVKKLRIAGIQTAATTKELVDAFQQAVGAGLATGLSLDEIRQVTIRIAQAAGALGVPYRQLNEEIRSILGGIIDQNTRIAKSLQITNEQVILAKEQGRLAEFLLDRFEAFGVAGDRIVETWAALKSNVKETFELFSGEATKPLFEALRVRGQGALTRIFDFDTAEISKDFEAILKTFQQIFAGIGDSLSGQIERAVDNAARLNQWLVDNRDVVTETVNEMGDVVKGIGSAIDGMARLTAGVVKWSVESKIASSVLDTVGDTLKTIGDSPIFTGGIALAGLVGIAALFTAVFGSTAAIVTAAALATGGLVAALDALHVSTGEAIERQTALNKELSKTAIETHTATVEAAKLAREYGKLQGVATAAGSSADEVAAAEKRMVEIQRELIRIFPEFEAKLKLVKERHQDVSEAINAEILERENLLVRQASNIAAMIAEEEAARKLAASKVASQRGRVTVGVLHAFGFQTSEERELAAREESIEALTDSYTGLLAVLRQLREAISGEATTLSGAGPEDDAEERLKAMRAQAEIDLAIIQAGLTEDSLNLKNKLDNDLINYETYYRKLNTIQQEAFKKQVAIQQALLRAETDPGRRGNLQAKIIQLESQARVALATNDAARTKAAEKFEDDFTRINIRLFEAIGETATATRMKLELEFRDILDVLRLDPKKNAKKIIAIEDLVDIEAARATLRDLENIVQRAQERLRARVDEIETLGELGRVTPDEARHLTADAYEDLRRVVQTALPDLQALSAQIQDPDDLLKVERLIALYDQLGLTITKLRDDWAEFRAAAQDAVTDSLANHLNEAIQSAEGLGDALNKLGFSIDGLRSLLGSIASALVELTTRMIAARIVAAAFGGFSDGGAVGAPGARYGGLVKAYAAGGMIRGPGTKTSDSILARLSSGEFVMQARSVDKYGSDFFQKLNAGLLPRAVASMPRYATGGMVSKPSGTQGGSLNGTLTIGLGEGLVLQQMDTPEGERLQLKVIQKNRRGIRASLGG